MTEDQLRAQLNAVYASSSWKITAPLRFCASFSLKTIRFRLFSPKKLTLAMIRHTVRQPWVERSGQRLLLRFPALKMRIKRVILSANNNAAAAYAFAIPMASEEQAITPAARAILHELRTAINSKK